MSCIKVDLPEPLTPVTQTKRCKGNSMAKFLRLCSRAPSNIKRGVWSVTKRFNPSPIVLRAPK